MKAFVSGYKTMWSKGLLSILIAYIVYFSIIYLKLKKYKDLDFLFFLFSKLYTFKYVTWLIVS